ncbi:hypothetical protein G8S55_11610 [Clostridium botulinum C]|uniref:hypothetical protein n=1 Tax=Clostridium botulinum TaxID=1491 RepID=UPI001E647F20|nr:hypothetical protein [Clostridium botulinum]MCD3217864.1 hypothetical protein [Clostridium botulinum C]
MENQKENYKYSCIKDYVNFGIESYKKLKESGLRTNDTNLNELDGAKIVLLDGNVFSIKLHADKKDFTINSCIYDIYEDEKGNFYTRIAKENSDPNFNNKFLYDALLNHFAIKLSEIIK